MQIMISQRCKIILGTLLLVLGHASLYAGKNDNTIYVQKHTPAWYMPVINNRQIAFITKSEMQFELTGKTKYFIDQKGSLYNRVLLRQIKLDGQSFWISPYVTVYTNPHGNIFFKVYPDNTTVPEIVYNGSIILMLFFAAAIIMTFRNNPELLVKHKTLFMAAFLLISHFLWVGYLTIHTAEWGHLPLDEANDFIDARYILDGNFSVRYHRTLGMALLYIPFILASGAENMYDLAPLISWFMALVVAPAGIVAAFFFVKSISKSAWVAFSSIMIFMLLPKIYLPVEIKDYSIFSLFFIYVDVYILTCYYQILSGFNSMSDTLAASLVFITLATATWQAPGYRRGVIVGMLYATACMVRVNMVFMAPVIAFIMWYGDDKILHDLRYTVNLFLLTIGAFVLIYWPQFLINQIQNGGILTYTYEYYVDGAGKGFEVSKMAKVTRYLMKIHYLYYGVFVSSCLLIKDSYKRNILTLWVVPMTIFFCGFWLGQPFRFLLCLLPGTIAALIILINETCRSGIDKKYLIMLGVMLAILAFPILPLYGVKNIPDNYSNLVAIRYYLAPATCLVLSLWFWNKKQWFCLTAVMIFGAVFLSSSVWVLFCLFFVLLGRTCIDCVRDFINIVAKKRTVAIESLQ